MLLEKNKENTGKLKGKSDLKMEVEEEEEEKEEGGEEEEEREEEDSMYDPILMLLNQSDSCRMKRVLSL